MVKSLFDHLDLTQLVRMKFVNLLALGTVTLYFFGSCTGQMRPEAHEALTIACSSTDWIIIASSPAISVAYPENIFDIDASAGHLSAIVECSEQVVKTIQISCISDNAEEYRNNFSVRILQDIIRIFNTDMMSEDDIEALWNVNSSYATKFSISLVNDKVWYLYKFNFPMMLDKNMGLIFFSKEEVSGRELEIIKNKVAHERQSDAMDVCEPFYARGPGIGKCDAKNLKNGSVVGNRLKHDLMGLLIAGTISMIFLLILGSFVVNAIMKKNSDYIEENVETNIRFDCYEGSN